MKPKEKRDRLFKSGRPLIRPLVVREGAGYSKDVGILWVAHQHNPFYGFEKDKETFLDQLETFSDRVSFYMIEDKNTEFKEQGPIGFLYVYNNDWEIEPHVIYFPWATTRNKLKGLVAFLQMVRYSRAIGVCVIHARRDFVPLLDKAKEYGVVHYVGRILNGYGEGDKFIYSVKGKKRYG